MDSANKRLLIYYFISQLKKTRLVTAVKNLQTNDKFLPPGTSVILRPGTN